jgi:hypothetical protein
VNRIPPMMKMSIPTEDKNKVLKKYLSSIKTKIPIRANRIPYKDGLQLILLNFSQFLYTK